MRSNDYPRPDASAACSPVTFESDARDNEGVRSGYQMLDASPQLIAPRGPVRCAKAWNRSVFRHDTGIWKEARVLTSGRSQQDTEMTQGLGDSMASDFSRYVVPLTPSPRAQGRCRVRGAATEGRWRVAGAKEQPATARSRTCNAWVQARDVVDAPPYPGNPRIHPPRPSETGQ